MSDFISYLSQLKFDTKLTGKLHAKYLKNIRIVILLVLTILAIGIISLINLPRRLNPSINLTIVIVSTVLPGAGPQDVESLVTIPLEDKLAGLQGLDTINSVSAESFSSIVMQFVSGVDKDKARSDAQTAVSSVTTLPSDARTPTVTALDFENTPVWTFTITGKSDTASLMRYADYLQDKIKHLPNIDHVALTGFETQEVEITLDPTKIREYNLSPLAVSQAVKVATQAFPSGKVDTNSSSFSLAIDAQATSVQDLRDLELTINGQPLKLGDIARVSEISKPNLQRSFLATNNQLASQAVTFSVFKTSSSDIVKTVNAIEPIIRQDVDSHNGQFTLTNVENFGEQIGKQFTDLIGEFRSTLVLVFINLLLFLGIKQALIACITIPLTFLSSFGWMSILGQTINFLTLFALLLAFGTSIDDTIVTVSAMTTYFRTGKFTPMETGLLVWRDLVIPIWTTTITTVWAFVPLLLTTGIIGEFIKPIPVVVAATMYSSTAVAWFITLPLLIVLLRPRFPRRVVILIRAIAAIATFAIIISVLPKTPLLLPILIVMALFLVISYRIRKVLYQRFIHSFLNLKWVKNTVNFLRKLFSNGILSTEKLSGKYRDLISRILASGRGRRITFICLGAFAVFSYSLIPLGLVKNEFFPKTNGDILYINLELPSGINQGILETEAKNILNDIRHTPETQAVTVDTGESIGSNGSESGGTNTAAFTLLLVPHEKRKYDSSVIADNLRKKYNNYIKGKISVIELGSGPPAGSDVQITLLGDDLNLLDAYSDKAVNFLKSQHGIINIDKSMKTGTSKIVFVPDKAKVTQAGLSLDTLGFWLRVYASGFTLDTARFNNKDVDVVFYTNSINATPEGIGNLAVPTPNGSVPLMSLGTIRLENNPTTITRLSQKRSVTISAGVLPGYSVSDANSKLLAYANNKLALPEGYSIKTGGVNEQNTKSVQSIFQAMGFSFLLIMATMVIQFGSYRQAAMILSLIPLAVSGVFIIFGLSGTPLSFPALIGVLALFGVVVTNAMFIVEKINQNRKSGMPLDQAIADAGQQRLEPIMLTSITSILGLVPITLANVLWRGLGGAIISGLLFSGIIMLFYIPVMYHTFYRREEENAVNK
jgi:multidrug efflux pump subunit AcrB